MAKRRDIPDGVIQTAVMVDLPKFLEEQQIELRHYRSCWEYGSGAEKVTIWQDQTDGHYQWKRQYDALSGNAIQWLMAFGGHSFVSAVFCLYDWAGGRPIREVKRRDTAAGAAEEKKKATSCLPPVNGSFRRCMAYLCQTRRIDPDVVTAFCAGRSRGLGIAAICQSRHQLMERYGQHGAAYELGREQGRGEIRDTVRIDTTTRILSALLRNTGMPLEQLLKLLELPRDQKKIYTKIFTKRPAEAKKNDLV